MNIRINLRTLGEDANGRVIREEARFILEDVKRRTDALTEAVRDELEGEP